MADSNHQKAKELTALENEFRTIIEDIEKEYTRDNESYLKKKTHVNQEAIDLMQDNLIKRCGKEKDELSKYMIIENQDGKQVGKILEGKDKEFTESYQKFFECSLPFNIIHESFIKNIEITSFYPVKSLKKCLKIARENYIQNKNKDEAKIYVSNCYNFVYDYNIPTSNKIDEKLLEHLKNEYKVLDEKL